MQETLCSNLCSERLIEFGNVRLKRAGVFGRGVPLYEVSLSSLPIYDVYGCILWDFLELLVSCFVFSSVGGSLWSTKKRFVLALKVLRALNRNFTKVYREGSSTDRTQLDFLGATAAGLNKKI